MRYISYRLRFAPDDEDLAGTLHPHVARRVTELLEQRTRAAVVDCTCAANGNLSEIDVQRKHVIAHNVVVLNIALHLVKKRSNVVNSIMVEYLRGCPWPPGDLRDSSTVVETGPLALVPER